MPGSPAAPRRRRAGAGGSEPPGQHAGDHDELTEAPELVGVANAPMVGDGPKVETTEIAVQSESTSSAPVSASMNVPIPQRPVGDLIAGQ